MPWDRRAGIADPQRRALLQSQLWTFENRWEGIWLFYDSEQMQSRLAELGLVKQTQCGDATILCVDSSVACDAALQQLLGHPEDWYSGEKLDWIHLCRQ